VTTVLGRCVRQIVSFGSRACSRHFVILHQLWPLVLKRSREEVLVSCNVVTFVPPRGGKT
jgi:hypothetical protein